MARGKYAARSANSRANEAATSADELRAILAAERSEHAATVAGLNTEIVRLRGRFESEVHALAAEEVAEAKRQAQAGIAAAQAERVAAGLAVHDFFRSGAITDCSPDEFYQRLRGMLGITLSDLDPSRLVDPEEFPLDNRRDRRRMKHAMHHLDADMARRRQGGVGKQYHGDDPTGRNRLGREVGVLLGISATQEPGMGTGAER